LGAVFEGYEAARQKYEELIAERHRREEQIDQHLRELAAILDEDVAFLQKNGITHELAGRALRVNRNRSPILTVHFEPDKAEYQVTFMVDGSRSTATATAECARAVGKMLFSMTIGPK
jgi:DNA repair exonuclease SbcCD ATPase subunit